MIDENDLTVLRAKQAITEALHRYCYALDDDDRETAYGTWHPDGTADYEGMFQGTGRDFIDHGRGDQPTPAGATHRVTNILIDVDGGRATSRCYVTAIVPLEAMAAQYVARGQFRDTWSLRAGAWRIDHRRFTDHGSVVVPLNHQLLAPEATA